MLVCAATVRTWKIVAVALLAFAIAVTIRTRRSVEPMVVPAVDMSREAQVRAREVCVESVSGDSGLKFHRRGKPDKILLYSWGDLFVQERPDVGRYQVKAFVDTAIDGTGNVERTPFVCAVGADFVVSSVGFGQIEFPRKIARLTGGYSPNLER